MTKRPKIPTELVCFRVFSFVFLNRKCKIQNYVKFKKREKLNYIVEGFIYIVKRKEVSSAGEEGGCQQTEHLRASWMLAMF